MNWPPKRVGSEVRHITVIATMRRMEPDAARRQCEEIAAAAIAGAIAVSDHAPATAALAALAPIQELLTELQRDLVNEALDAGTSVRTTARAANRTTATIQNWRKRAEK